MKNHPMGIIIAIMHLSGSWFPHSDHARCRRDECSPSRLAITAPQSRAKMMMMMNTKPSGSISAFGECHRPTLHEGSSSGMLSRIWSVFVSRIMVHLGGGHHDDAGETLRVRALRWLR